MVFPLHSVNIKSSFISFPFVCRGAAVSKYRASIQTDSIKVMQRALNPSNKGQYLVGLPVMLHDLLLHIKNIRAV